MLTQEDQVVWQRAEAQLTAQFESLLRALVSTSDAVQSEIGPAQGTCGRSGDAYHLALEKARAQLDALDDHRKRFAEAKAEASEGMTRVLPGGPQTQSFGVLQNGANWRDLRGGKR